jgi:hypothetical protein
VFDKIHFCHASLFDWIDGNAGTAASRFDLALMLRMCDIFSHYRIEDLSYREARRLIRRERRAFSVDTDTTNPAKLIEENKLDKLHHRLWRSQFRSGIVFHQFSLSDVFRAIKMVLDAGVPAVENTIYAPVRRFDESALVLPSGRSLIGELMKMADKLLIEDSELTAGRLQRHIDLFGLSQLSISDFSEQRGGRGATVSVIGKKQPADLSAATAAAAATN